ncbi:MAG: hypothetical protein OEZ65_10880 [Gemmatimonadota bacterium]|nr:hypothetical protein [Gemmatimonadota bacterium]MDH5760082.1 hypothetical protein [Gemmatimonadota bacterium]
MKGWATREGASFRSRSGATRLTVLGAALVMAGCGGEDLSLPAAGDVARYFAAQSGLQTEMSGNVANVYVTQSATQLRRGGSLWAKVGPYIYLFTEETHQLLVDYPGLAGVRVVTRTPGGTEVARAMVTRHELSDVLWRRAMNIAGRARRDGTTKVTLLSDLVRWGEDHTEFAYNPQYVSTP